MAIEHGKSPVPGKEPAAQPGEPGEPAKGRVVRCVRPGTPARAPEPHVGVPAPAVPVGRRPLPAAMAKALCDLVADPMSGITGVRVCGTAARTVEGVEAAAAERGLVTESAASPSLGRGWIRIARPVGPVEAARECEPAPNEKG